MLLCPECAASLYALVPRVLKVRVSGHAALVHPRSPPSTATAQTGVFLGPAFGAHRLAFGGGGGRRHCGCGGG